jgi:OmcA/MtrC family decaheme c-type cytochrome
MKRTLIRLGLTALISSALFGCGGGSDGASGSNAVVQVGPSTPASTIATNASTPTSASVQAWRALEPKITVTGVSINSPPVVSFAVTDANGAAVVGLGNRSQATSATSSSVSALTNLSFTIAKLVPATASAPSKWVSYLVTKPITVEQKNGTIKQSDADKASCKTIADVTWCGTYPTTDKEGTLVDNGDGTYKYTFFRDIKQVANIVANLPPSADGLKVKDDLGDLTYDPSLTHRVGIVISGAAPGTGTNVPSGTQVIPGTNIAIAANLVYDFRPDGGAVSTTRSVVDISSCASCHNGKGLAHGGARKDPNLCVTCHTDQVKYGMSGEATRASTTGVGALALNGTTQNTTSVLDGRAIGNYPNMIHKFHMGDRLHLSGYNYIPNSSGVGVQFEKDEWIQDPRNCTKCHSGADKTDINQATKTKDGDNWKTKPSRLACGACHDNVNFATGVITNADGTTSNHKPGPASDDSSCASCHATSAAGAEAPIDIAHRTEASTVNNKTVITGISSISYEISSVTLNASRQPVFKFRILQDGAPVTSFNVPTPTGTPLAIPSTFQPITGFSSGPTFYIAYAVPQDGVAKPADFNVYQNVSLASLLVQSGAPKTGTMSGTVAGGTITTTDKDGYFTATITGDTVGQPVATGCALKDPAAAPFPAGPSYCVYPVPIVVPTNAMMVTGAMIGTFTQRTFGTADLTTKYGSVNPTTGAFVAGSVSSGLILKSPLKKLLATDPLKLLDTAKSGAGGNVARRVVVDTLKCESCHEQLGTAVDFHSGARNDATACAICHRPNQTSSGWAADASTFIHGIHAGTDPASVALINLRTKVTGCTPVSTADNKNNPAQTCYPDGDPGTGSGGAGTGYSSGKRTIPFSWHRDALPTKGGFNAAAVVYPGILKRCDNCHVPNAVNFGANGPALLPNLLWSTSGTGKYDGVTDSTNSVTSGSSKANKVYPRDPSTGSVIYITADNVKNYGNVFTYAAPGTVVPKLTDSSGGPATGTFTVAGSTGSTVPADPETLVQSPVTSACFACHDSTTAKLHFNQYGGVFYGARKNSDSTFPTTGTYTGTLVNKETCLICHGMGRDQDAAVVHAK